MNVERAHVNWCTRSTRTYSADTHAHVGITPSRCFSLANAKRRLHLEADTSDARKIWIRGLRYILMGGGKECRQLTYKSKMRRAQERGKQHVGRHHAQLMRKGGGGSTSKHAKRTKAKSKAKALSRGVKAKRIDSSGGGGVNSDVKRMSDRGSDAGREKKKKSVHEEIGSVVRTGRPGEVAIRIKHSRKKQMIKNIKKRTSKSSNNSRGKGLDSTPLSSSFSPSSVGIEGKDRERHYSIDIYDAEANNKDKSEIRNEKKKGDVNSRVGTKTVPAKRERRRGKTGGKREVTKDRDRVRDEERERERERMRDRPRDRERVRERERPRERDYQSMQ